MRVMEPPPTGPAPHNASRDHARHDLPELLRRAATHDHDAWNTLTRLYARRLYALAFAHLRSEPLAEDVAQSVFLTLAQQLDAGTYSEQNRFEPWLFRIAMNRVRDEARRQKKSPRSLTSAPAPPATTPSAHDTLEARDNHDRLRRAIDTLAPDEQNLIAMRHHAAMSFKDIADTLDQPIGTLLARHHRALKKLKALLDPPDRDTKAPSP